MNAKIETQEPDLTPASYTDWRPPGWIVGDVDEPYTPEDRVVDGVEVPGIVRRYAEYEAAGYYTRGGTLTEKGRNAKDEADARDVLHNNRLLRDAWNTPGIVWRLAASLTGREFAVDPFWNQGAQDLPALSVRLNGLSPLMDGMLTVAGARAQLERETFRTEHGAPICKELERRLVTLGEVPDDFPVNWRQGLAVGEAPAAANGPHSCSGTWLRSSAAYGTQELSAAFVPDNGDGWFQRTAMTATLVIRLGRVPCFAPPGIIASSPRGASALLIWIPPALRKRVEETSAKLSDSLPSKRARELKTELDALLPEPTRRVLLDGKSFAVPLWNRPKAGTQYAIVQRGDLLDGPDAIVDLGLAGA